MAKITKINHIAVAVNDVEGALPVGESEVELVKPTADDTSLAKFLAERGGGLHHLCFEVDDIVGVLADLKAKGMRLIDETPKVLPGRKMAFVPKAPTGCWWNYTKLPAERYSGPG